MPEVSRRRLFGLMAGAAAAPMVGKVSLAPAALPPDTIAVNPAIYALFQRAIDRTRAQMVENLYGPSLFASLASPGLATLTGPEEE